MFLIYKLRSLLLSHIVDTQVKKHVSQISLDEIIICLLICTREIANPATVPIVKIYFLIVLFMNRHALCEQVFREILREFLFTSSETAPYHMIILIQSMCPFTT